MIFVNCNGKLKHFLIHIIQNAETFPMDDVNSDGIVSIVDAPNIQKTVVP